MFKVHICLSSVGPTPLFHVSCSRYIKLSSPKLNNVAVNGCILVYLAVILQGLDNNTVEHHVFPYVCSVSESWYAAVQNQKVVTAYFSNKQLLYFGSAQQHSRIITT